MEEGGSGTGSSATRPQGPRLYHKKSKTGCLRCKQRRVKCDEKRPACGGCSRHLVECVYASATPNARGKARSRNLRSNANARSTSGASRASDGGQEEDEEEEDNSTNREEGDGTTSSSYLAPPLNVPRHSRGPTPSGSSSAPAEPFDADRLQRIADYQERRLAEDGGPRGDSWDEDEYDAMLEAETYERRRWELKLLHNFMLNQTKVMQMLNPSRRGQAFVWTFEIPKMAMEHDCVLYAMLAQSALQMWTVAVSSDFDDDGELTPSQDPKALAEREWLRTLQRRYLTMALREQRAAVSTLRTETADEVCMSSLVIMSHSFALVQTVPLDPWEPPLEWLRMGRGVGAVFMMARGYLGSEGERMMRFLSSLPNFDPDEMFTEENRAHLVWLLDSPVEAAETSPARTSVSGEDCLMGMLDSITTATATPSTGSTSLASRRGPNWDRELDDKSTRQVYKRTLSYIGWAEKFVRSGETGSEVLRQLAGFAVWAPTPFEGFLEQRRPRALVVMAHFFGLWCKFEEVWMLGKTGRRQIRAIHRILPPEWQPKLDGLMREHGI